MNSDQDALQKEMIRALLEEGDRLRYWLRQLGAEVYPDDMGGKLAPDGVPLWGWLSTHQSVGVTEAEASELEELL